jgi:hypothetical protein
VDRAWLFPNHQYLRQRSSKGLEGQQIVGLVSNDLRRERLTIYSH